ncbi:MAG TPA: S53 family peptidase [Thermoleophilaceae bacterium]
MKLTRLLAAGAALFAIAAGTTASSSAQVSVQLPNLQNGIQTLTGNVLQSLGNATPASPAPAGQRMRIGFVVAHPHQAAEDSALRSLYSPNSAEFHRFFTPKTYAQHFAVSKANAAAVRGWLASRGLHVDYVSGARDYFLASGTVSQVDRLLGTQLDVYSFKGARFMANATAPKVPAKLHVLQVLGLNTFQRFHTMSQEGALRGAVPAATGAPNIGAQTPQDLWSVYQQPKNETGKGVSVAILGNGATDSVIKDLHQFDTENHFSQLPVQVVHTPANGSFTDTSGNEEWNIDMQAINGMAPGISKEVLYFSPTLADTDLVASTATWVNDPHGPPIMNASLGECEVTPLNSTLNDPSLSPLNGNENPSALPVSQGLSNSSEPAQTQLLKQAVMEGRTLFASSGDSGSSCTVVYPGTNGVGNYVVPLTEDPADTPYTVGVGGTVLYTDGGTPAQRTFEYSWTHGGGNASPFIPAPSYQQHVTNLTRTCIADSGGGSSNAGKLCRGVPDVSAISGDVISNGYTIVSDGSDSEGGGTSLSSPLWTGMWARVVGTSPGKRGYGFANPLIYAIGKNPKAYGQSFYDITTGTNGLNQAQSGWDYTTGFGVPRLSGLLKNVQALSHTRKRH